jgi:hypothetical protein
MIEAAFAAFAIAALPLFRFVTPSRAVAITCFAGWLLLPVGIYPPGSADVPIPYWITGAAVPSDMLLTKMWWPPVVALAGALLSDRRTLARWRPGWADIPMALWCLWPIGQWFVLANPESQPWTNPAPQPLIASLYLAAAWGVPWFLGRVYFCGDEGGRRLVAAIVGGVVVLAPIAVIEGLWGPQVYGWLYERHPFRFDGDQRYIGFRPIAFFEHGNQYGIWVAATALCAIWLWQSTPKSRLSGGLAAVAVLGLAIALMSQSMGAILLLCMGLALLWTLGHPLTRWMLPLFLLLMVSAGAVYLSGAVPLRAIAKNTVIGQHVVNFLRMAGRESFVWRIAVDQRALPLISEHLMLGAARWDWWRQNGERPWDLTLIIVGQFGLVGLMLAFGSLLTPALRALAIQSYPEAWRLHPTLPLAMIVLMAIGDALFNSFLFYPAILASGALAADECRNLRLARAQSTTTAVQRSSRNRSDANLTPPLGRRVGGHYNAKLGLPGVRGRVNLNLIQFCMQ